MIFRLGYIAVTVSTILVAGCGTKESGEEPVRPVRVMKVADLEGVTARSFPGRASAAQEVDLAFRVAGPLVALPVNVGDEVSEGDTVAQIDRRDFEVTLLNARANLERARANEKRAQDDLDRFLKLQRMQPDAAKPRR